MRFSNAPECVLHLRPVDRPWVAAGTLTIGGPIVGTPGAAEAPFVIEPDACDGSYFGFGPTYPPSDELAVEVSLAGRGVFPTMPAQTLIPSPADPVEILSPLPDELGAIAFPSTEDFEIAWVPPLLGGADQRLVFGLAVSADPHQPMAELYCGFPLDQGQATIPANVLGEVAQRIGSAAMGMVHLLAGGQREVAVGDASYVIEVARGLDSSTIAYDVGAELRSDLVPPPPPEPEPIVIPEPTGPAPGGAVHCAHALGGAGSDRGVVAVAADGSIFVAGTFEQTASFGATDAGEVTLGAAGEQSDLFIARYDSDCRVLWARRAGGPGGDSLQGIALAAGDGVYVTGLFSETAVFGPGEAGEQSVTAKGQADLFVARYAGDGTLVWVRAGGGTGNERAHGIAATPTGLYVSGRFAGTATFGDVELVAGAMYGATAFVVRYGAAGDVEWARRVGDGDSGDVDVFDVAAAGEDLVMTGNYQSMVVFGPGEAHETSFEAPCWGVDAFVARYGRAGELAWAKRFAGPGFDLPSAIAVDAQGSVLVTGSVSGEGPAASATFGAGEGGEVSVPVQGSEVFVASFDGATGEVLFARSGGSAFGEHARAIHPTSDGFVVAGTFGRYADSGFAVFGRGEANETTLIGAAGDDLFIALYDASGALVWARAAGGTSTGDWVSSVSVGPQGEIVVGGAFTETIVFDETSLGPAADRDAFLTVYRP